jgi:hypothetical protein
MEQPGPCRPLGSVSQSLLNLRCPNRWGIFRTTIILFDYPLATFEPRVSDLHK